jgi:murein DD-endopeptidase MepM/ murein hydrolase activator NlpD
VQVGDTVQKGQAIALIGSTGRSTGPHLHFEVLKQGRAVDPMTFVRR